MKSKNQAIGIFDSGIGGLTVANAIARELPNEDFIYFGDTAHLPYGDQSADTIRYYSLRIAKFLLDQNCVEWLNQLVKIRFQQFLLFVQL